MEAARKDAIAKMQDMRTEVRKWQAAARQAERERDHASASAANSGSAAGFDATIDAALGMNPVASSGAADDHRQMEGAQSPLQRQRTRSANAAAAGEIWRDPQAGGNSASPSRVVRRIPGLDAALGVADLQRTGLEPEPEVEPRAASRRSVTGMPSLFASPGGSGNRVAAMRSRMKQAMQKEEDPNRLTELVLESMEFGDALEIERTALQARLTCALPAWLLACLPASRDCRLAPLSLSLSLSAKL